MKKAPAAFIGHGSPMNIIADNSFTRDLRAFGKTMSDVDAVVVVSAHWLTKGSYVCSLENPKQIFDFYKFPRELYQIRYRPKGSPRIAEMIEKQTDGEVKRINDWGLDHASWALMYHMFPAADKPVIQISINIESSVEKHYELGKKLSFLRDENVLVIGSGNIVHNLRDVNWEENAEPFKWAVEFDRVIDERVMNREFDRVVSYNDITKYEKAVPTNDHYIPLIYFAGMIRENDSISLIHTGIQNGSVSMRSFVAGS